MDKNELRELTKRLVAIRTRLLSSYPFFGRLLLHLAIGYADCETAFTDMKKIVFDPKFANRLSDEEVRFVFLHELMHCVLHHCTRGRTLQPYLYNIACDIVVNSLILETLGLDTFFIDGSELIHLVPDGREGREFSAEQVYEMLLSAPADQIAERYGDAGFDTHIVWAQIADSLSDDEWDRFVKESAIKTLGSSAGLPGSLRRYLADIAHTPKTNWRQILHDFIQNDRSDYSYQSPDRRFQGDVILPSFRENMYGDRIERLWFLIDTSASVSDEALSEAFHEIKDALDQIESVSGDLSFFDEEVTEPVPFFTAEDLFAIKPIGGGGTSFSVIFRALDEFYKDELPTAIIILTDGYASFPPESAARDVPVLWIIIDSDEQAPWGECIHIES